MCSDGEENTHVSYHWQEGLVLLTSVVFESRCGFASEFRVFGSMGLLGSRTRVATYLGRVLTYLTQGGSGCAVPLVAGRTWPTTGTRANSFPATDSTDTRAPTEMRAFPFSSSISASCRHVNSLPCQDGIRDGCSACGMPVLHVLMCRVRLGASSLTSTTLMLLWPRRPSRTLHTRLRKVDTKHC